MEQAARAFTPALPDALKPHAVAILEALVETVRRELDCIDKGHCAHTARHLQNLLYGGNNPDGIGGVCHSDELRLWSQQRGVVIQINSAVGQQPHIPDDSSISL